PDAKLAGIHAGHPSGFSFAHLPLQRGGESGAQLRALFMAAKAEARAWAKGEAHAEAEVNVERHVARHGGSAVDRA
ncbi:hypothetical protein, partial [Dyella ginsengisoli]|uniref:hypothetical protein n=1 Tax=Dyella ginsengisoli TaxID=363848 RepID=UPI0019D6DE17